MRFEESRYHSQAPEVYQPSCPRQELFCYLLLVLLRHKSFVLDAWDNPADLPRSQASVPDESFALIILPVKGKCMGLDMYLTKHTYVKNWDHLSPEERHTITVTRKGEKTHVKPERISHIIEEVGYWRKANAIHSWFVENVQSGDDRCELSSVSREQLTELLALVNEVLNNRTRAEELLPSQAGFFFGSTEYDEYYFEDLKLTKEILENALEDNDKSKFYYQSSW